jgi:hypothetical protein
MQDAKTYRRFADDCMKLAKTMPEHRNALVEMAATWQRLADAVEERARGEETSGGEETSRRA